jgi:hypothetical protein
VSIDYSAAQGRSDLRRRDAQPVDGRKSLASAWSLAEIGQLRDIHDMLYR